MMDGNKKNRRGGRWLKKKFTDKTGIVMLVIITMVYLMCSSTVLAFDPMLFGETGIQVSESTVNGKWTPFPTDKPDTITGSLEPADSDSSSTSTSYAKARSDTVTITNTSETETKVVSFNYAMQTTSMGSVKVGDDSILSGSGQKTYSQTLAPGESFNIVLTSGTTNGKDPAEATATVVITDFKAETVQTITVTLEKPTYGSYTASTTNGSEPVTMTPKSTPTSFSFVSSAGIKLTSSDAEDNYYFDRWEKADGTAVSYTDGATIVGGYSNGDMVVASFLPDAKQRVFTVGSNRYYSWEDAMDDAYDSHNPVVLNRESYTLPWDEGKAIDAGEKLPVYDSDGNITNGVGYVKVTDTGIKYTVAEGVTFVIPYDDTLSSADSHKNNGAPANGSAGYTLTVEPGCEIVVPNAATFLVNAKRTSNGTGKQQGVTTGPYGKLVMGGTMTVDTGGKLYAWGYVVDKDHTTHTYGSGSGRIIAIGGSEVQVLFQIMNHRGGTSTVSAVAQNIMPITNYYVSNIMMRAEYAHGSKLTAAYNAYVSTPENHYDGAVTLVSTSDDNNALFALTSRSQIVMDYNYQSDQMYAVVQSGSVNMQKIVLEIMGYQLDTSKMILPVPDNMQIYIGDPNGGTTANASVTSPIKLLPGAGIHVKENCTLNIPSGSAIYLYADEDYVSTWSFGVYRTTLYIKDTYKEKSAKITVASDAAIYNEGTINLQGSILQSGTNGSERVNRIIPMSETAVLNVGNIAISGKVKEYANTDSSTEFKQWKCIDGWFVDEDSITNFTTNGIYKTVKQTNEDQYRWYNYSVTYKFQDENGNEITNLLGENQNPDYVVGDTILFKSSDITAGKYYITGYAVESYQYNDPNKVIVDITDAVTVSDGLLDRDKNEYWEDMEISGIASGYMDLTVTLTVVPYDYRLNWAITIGEGTPAYYTEYVQGKIAKNEWTGSAKLTTTVTPGGIAQLDVNVIEDDPNTEGDETKTTLHVTNLSGKEVDGILTYDDISVAVTVNQDYWQVNWSVFYPGCSKPVKKEDWIPKGTETSLTFANVLPDDLPTGWYIVEEDAFKVTDSVGKNIADVVGVINGKTLLTLGKITCTTNVEVTVAYYAHQITFKPTTDTVLQKSTDTVTLDPVYVKETGGTVEIQYTDIKVTDNQYKYIFDIENPPQVSENDTGDANPSATNKVLTIADVVDDCLINVTLKHYDYIVTVKEVRDQGTANTVDSRFINSDLGIPLTYDFEGVNIDSYDPVTTAAVTYDPAKPDPETPNVTVPSHLSISNVTDDTTVTVHTSSFDHILTIKDQEENQLVYERVKGDKYPYNCVGKVIVTDAATEERTGTADVDYAAQTSVVIDGMTGNPVITLTLESYSNKVTWNVDGKSSTDYLTGGRTTSNYLAPDGCVITFSSATTTGSGPEPTHKKTTSTEKCIEYTDINRDLNVEVTLAEYDYEVRINEVDINGDSNEVSVFYVSEDYPDQEVIYGDDITYQVDGQKYFNALKLNEGAIVTVNGEDNTNTDVSKGWESFELTGIGSDVTVDVKLYDYDFKVTWSVIIPETEKPVTEVHYVTAGEDGYGKDSYTLTGVPEGRTYSIIDIVTDPAVDLEKNPQFYYTGKGESTANLYGISSDVTVAVEARDYLYKIQWQYELNGETYKDGDPIPFQEEPEGGVRWDNLDALIKAGKLPALGTSESYVVTGATFTNGTGTHTNKTVTVTERIGDASEVTVTIHLEKAVTGYQVLWGRMDYKYYKNGAFYSRVEDGETYKWKLMDSYTWTPMSGGMVTYINNVPYTVPNGSVMVVNPTNQQVKAIITVQLSYNEADWVIGKVPRMTLTVKDKEGNTVGEPIKTSTETGKVQIEITLQAGEYYVITGTMEGTPLETIVLDEVEVGTWAVTIQPID